MNTVPKVPSQQPDPQVTPNSKLEKRSRRVFTTEYKLKIIQQANECKHGEVGKLLRRENLYSAQLNEWRHQYAQNGVAGLDKSAPGPASFKSAEQRQIEKLEKQVAKLKGDLGIANDCLDIQKRVLSILDRSSNGSTQ
ncbi:transposase [bacterium]|nr:transposase [bacterium]